MPRSTSIRQTKRSLSFPRSVNRDVFVCPEGLYDDFSSIGVGSENMVSSSCGYEASSFYSIKEDSLTSETSNESSDIDNEYIFHNREYPQRKFFFPASIPRATSNSTSSNESTSNEEDRRIEIMHNSYSIEKYKKSCDRRKKRQTKEKNRPLLSLSPSTTVLIYVHTTSHDLVLKIPISQILRREKEMIHIAAKKKVSKSVWNGSLIYQTCDQTYVTSKMNSSISISIPGDNSVPDYSSFISNLLSTYYAKGIIYCLDLAQGPEVLHLLEYFQILYFPSNMVFQSIGAFLRVRLWGDYFLGRPHLLDWIYEEILGGSKIRRGVGFVVSDKTEALYYYKGRQMVLFNVGDTPMGLFASSEDEQGLDEILRNDFSIYLQNALPGTTVWFRIEKVERKSMKKRGRYSVDEKRPVLYIDFHPKKKYRNRSRVIEKVKRKTSNGRGSFELEGSKTQVEEVFVTKHSMHEETVQKKNSQKNDYTSIQQMHNIQENNLAPYLKNSYTTVSTTSSSSHSKKMRDKPFDSFDDVVVDSFEDTNCNRNNTILNEEKSSRCKNDEISKEIGNTSEKKSFISCTLDGKYDSNVNGENNEKTNNEFTVTRSYKLEKNSIPSSNKIVELDNFGGENKKNEQNSGNEYSVSSDTIDHDNDEIFGTEEKKNADEIDGQEKYDIQSVKKITKQGNQNKTKTEIFEDSYYHSEVNVKSVKKNKIGFMKSFLKKSPSTKIKINKSDRKTQVEGKRKLIKDIRECTNDRDKGSSIIDSGKHKISTSTKEMNIEEVKENLQTNKIEMDREGCETTTNDELLKKEVSFAANVGVSMFLDNEILNEREVMTKIVKEECEKDSLQIPKDELDVKKSNLQRDDSSRDKEALSLKSHSRSFSGDVISADSSELQGLDIIADGEEFAQNIDLCMTKTEDESIDNSMLNVLDSKKKNNFNKNLDFSFVNSEFNANNETVPVSTKYANLDELFDSLSDVISSVEGREKQENTDAENEKYFSNLSPSSMLNLKRLYVTCKQKLDSCKARNNDVGGISNFNHEEQKSSTESKTLTKNEVCHHKKSKTTNDYKVNRWLLEEELIESSSDDESAIPNSFLDNSFNSFLSNEENLENNLFDKFQNCIHGHEEYHCRNNFDSENIDLNSTDSIKASWFWNRFGTCYTTSELSSDRKLKKEQQKIAKRISTKPTPKIIPHKSIVPPKVKNENYFQLSKEESQQLEAESIECMRFPLRDTARVKNIVLEEQTRKKMLPILQKALDAKKVMKENKSRKGISTSTTTRPPLLKSKNMIRT